MIKSNLTHDDFFNLQADFCFIFQNPTRLKILWFLEGAEKSVSEIVEAVGTSLSNVSQHLRIMKGLRIITSRKEAQWMYYRITNEKFIQGPSLVKEGIIEVYGLYMYSEGAAMAQETADKTTRTPYRIKVHNMETCNCNHRCGCQFGGFPDNANCEAVIGYEVIEGHYGDVDLAGVRLVVAAKWPGAIHDGHGQAVMFVDETASPGQVEGMAMIFSGQAGGMPGEAFAATFDSVEGPILKPIEMRADGRRSSFRIPDTLEVNMTPLKDPVSGKEKEIHIVYPKGGFEWNDGNVCTAETMRIDYGDFKFQHPGKFAAYATPEWTNQK